MNKILTVNEALIVILLIKLNENRLSDFKFNHLCFVCFVSFVYLFIFRIFSILV